MWETFLMKELPPILEKDWRSTDVRGIEGLSMGGSAAMMLAARNPGYYKFAASFSGILQLTSPGMAQAIQFAQRDGVEPQEQQKLGQAPLRAGCLGAGHLRPAQQYSARAARITLSALELASATDLVPGPTDAVT